MPAGCMCVSFFMFSVYFSSHCRLSKVESMQITLLSLLTNQYLIKDHPALLALRPIYLMRIIFLVSSESMTTKFLWFSVSNHSCLMMLQDFHLLLCAIQIPSLLCWESEGTKKWSIGWDGTQISSLVFLSKEQYAWSPSFFEGRPLAHHHLLI